PAARPARNVLLDLGADASARLVHEPGLRAIERGAVPRAGRPPTRADSPDDIRGAVRGLSRAWILVGSRPGRHASGARSTADTGAAESGDSNARADDPHGGRAELDLV